MPNILNAIDGLLGRTSNQTKRQPRKSPFQWVKSRNNRGTLNRLLEISRQQISLARDFSASETGETGEYFPKASVFKIGFAKVETPLSKLSTIVRCFYSIQSKVVSRRCLQALGRDGTTVPRSLFVTQTSIGSSNVLLAMSLQAKLFANISDQSQPKSAVGTSRSRCLR